MNKEAMNMEKIDQLIEELERQLKDEETLRADAEVVFVNKRGAFETNFESKRVQLKFLRGIKKAATIDIHRGEAEAN